jgi:hypothetical protein
MPRLLDQVEAAFEAVDRLLAAAQPPPPERVEVPWADDHDLMNLMHELFSAETENDGELALRRIAHLKSDLSTRHGIDVVLFDGTNDALFSFGRNLDPADPRYTTVRPALVTADRTLRRGEVRGPVRPPVPPDTPRRAGAVVDEPPPQEAPPEQAPPKEPPLEHPPPQDLPPEQPAPEEPSTQEPPPQARDAEPGEEGGSNG